MKNKHVIELEMQMKHWTERKDGLLVWLETHDYEHKDFMQNLNDLRAAECKVSQIESRIKRQGSLAFLGTMASITLPIISVHYSF
jgi:hypothetical protein